MKPTVWRDNIGFGGTIFIISRDDAAKLLRKARNNGWKIECRRYRKKGYLTYKAGFLSIGRSLVTT